MTSEEEKALSKCKEALTTYLLLDDLTPGEEKLCLLVGVLLDLSELFLTQISSLTNAVRDSVGGDPRRIEDLEKQYEVKL